MPRYLRLLQIDDDITDPVLANAVKNKKRIAPFIDPVPIPVDGVDHVGISTWSSAVAFWAQFDPIKHDLPDLITSDIRFRDATSPLGSIHNKPLLPTGFSHFKPFAAMSKITGRPIGYSVHTAERNYWRGLLELPSTGPEQRTLALLAAHEAAELAAILGELPTHSPSERLEIGLKWLADVNTHTEDFGTAWRAALVSYRKDLLHKLKSGRVVMLPSDWAALRNWCERMASSPEPVSADIGFAFVAAGKREDISMRSLFADVVGRKGGEFGFEYDSLPAHCFALMEMGDAAALDSRQFPRIGALVQAARFGHDIYAEVMKCLDAYPIADLADGVKLSKFQPDDGPLHYGDTTLAVAIVFQILRRDWMRRNLWNDVYNRYAWDHDKADFSDRIDESASLRVRVHQLDRHLATYFDGIDFTAAQIGDSVAVKKGRERPEWQLAFAKVDSTNVLLEILADLGAVHIVATEGKVPVYDYDGSRDLSPLPSIPSSTRTRLLAKHPLAALLQLDDPRFIRKIFHMGGDDHAWRRKIAAGFGLAEEKLGSALFEAIIDGSGGPSWVKTLARQYARDLGWPEEDWPRMLR
jgi:hypothetical protein